MDDVKVHYNSDKPAQLNALAYAQGTDIHVGTGQEKHLPHEAWHVIQQKQGRVQPTMQMQGVNVNNNAGLEEEADVMGEMSNKIGQKKQKDAISDKNIINNSGNKILQFTGIMIDDTWVNGSREEDLSATLWEIMMNCAFKGGDYKMSHDAYKRYFDAFSTITSPSSYDIAVIDFLKTEMSRCVPLIQDTQPYSEFTDIYREWNPSKKAQTFDTTLGPLNMRHSRHAPFISTNRDQYPGTQVKVDYNDIIEALKKEGVDDSDIANILLIGQTEDLTDPNAIRAAAMLIGIVYVAEQWRKQGAVKVFRAILRLIKSGKMTLSDIPSYYDFVKSAADGREQVIRMWSIMEGKIELDSLEGYEQEIYGEMSPFREGDLESDDEMRALKDSEFKSGRPGMD